MHTIQALVQTAAQYTSSNKAVNTTIIEDLADTIFDDLTLADPHFDELNSYAIILQAMQAAKTFVRNIAYTDKLLLQLITMYVSTFEAEDTAQINEYVTQICTK